MQRVLSRILSRNPEILVVGFAHDGYEALARIEELSPNVVTLDIRMPGMDGIGTLRMIRERNPEVRVIMCSGDTERGAKATLDALMAGASHCVAKPNGMDSGEVACARFAEEIVRKVCLHRMRSETASGSHPVNPVASPQSSRANLEGHLPGAKASPTARDAVASAARRCAPEVLAIGTSTGGPAALSDILPMLPAGFPLPVLIVQHMPPLFTRQLAERLSRISRIPVVEGLHGMEVTPGQAIIAPGDYHMRVVRRVHRVEIELTQEEPENSCRPAVDVLFRSVAEVYGRNVIAVVLTGMGQDGLQGAQTLKARENSILVQDQATSVVWGMPRAIAEAGIADAVLPLNKIIPEVMRRI
jgi:two-component system chemotaxis response regulator CheB